MKNIFNIFSKYKLQNIRKKEQELTDEIIQLKEQIIELKEEIEELKKVNNLQHKLMSTAEWRGSQKGFEEASQKYKRFLDSLLDPDQYAWAVTPQMRDEIRILMGRQPVERK